MKVGVGIDDWKLPIFERHLREAGYKYSSRPFTKDTLILKVETDDQEALQRVVVAANAEAAAQLLRRDQR